MAHSNTTTEPLEGFDSAKAYDNVLGASWADCRACNSCGALCCGGKYVPLSKALCSALLLCGSGRTVPNRGRAGHRYSLGYRPWKHYDLVQSEALVCVGSRLRMLHVNDNLAKGDNHLPPFLGTVNWQDMMRGLSSVGFDGYFNYEINVGNQPSATRAAFGAYLRQAADVLISMM